MTKNEGDYAFVNGLKMYYETHGTEEPLILIHGGFGASEMLKPIISELSKDRQVITPHLQVSGLTADIDRPLSYEFMADDIVALMKHLNIESADIIGLSLGGSVSLQIAIRNPEMIRKLVVISTPFKLDGFYPEVLETLQHIGPESVKFMVQKPLLQLYPDADWESLYTKIGNLYKQNYDWSKDVARIKSPIMIVFGDADAIRTSHMMEFFKLFGGGKKAAGPDGSGRPDAWFAILPGVTHYDSLYFPSMGTILTTFLNASMKPKS